MTDASPVAEPDLYRLGTHGMRDFHQTGREGFFEKYSAASGTWA
jgi:hypothetical protein